MSIPQSGAAHIHIAGWEMVPGWDRRQFVTSHGARRQFTILPFFFLWRNSGIVRTRMRIDLEVSHNPDSQVKDFPNCNVVKLGKGVYSWIPCA